MIFIWRFRGPKISIFTNPLVWKLLKRLLEEPLASRQQSFLTLDRMEVPRPLKLSQPILLLLSQLFTLAEKASVDMSPLTETLLDILTLCLTQYDEQLGTGLAQYVSLLEASLRAPVCSGLPEIVLSCFKLAMGFLRTQKKAGALFLERLLPLVSLAFSKNLATDGYWSVLKDFMESIDQTRTGLGSSLELFVKQNASSLSSCNSWDQVTFFETGTNFSSHLLAKVLKDAPGTSGAFICFLYELNLELCKEFLSRTLAFDLFVFFVISLSRTDEPDYSKLLQALARTNMYQHRNDDIYMNQTAFLRTLLLGNGHGSWTAIQAVTALNYYLMVEHLDVILTRVKIDPCQGALDFILRLLEMANAARQFPLIVKALIRADLDLANLFELSSEPSAPLLVSTIRGLPRPQLEETVTVLIELTANRSSWFLASLLIQQGAYPEALLPLLPMATSTDANVERFVLTLLSRAPEAALEHCKTFDSTVVKVFASHFDGSLSDDQLSSLKPDVLVRLLPILPLSSTDKVVPWLVDGILEGNNAAQLLRLASFFEIPIIKTGLVPHLTKLTREKPFGPLAQLILALPVEIFSNAQELFDRLIELSVDDDLKICCLVWMSSNEGICVSPNIVESLWPSMLKVDRRVASKLVTACLKSAGYTSLLQVLSVPKNLSDGLILKPLFSLGNLEKYLKDDSLARFIEKLVEEAQFLHTTEQLDLLDAIIGAVFKLNLGASKDILFNRLTKNLHFILNGPAPAQLMVCIAKLLRCLNNGDFVNVFLKRCIDLDAASGEEDYGKAILIILESMPLELLQDTLEQWKQTFFEENNVSRRPFIFSYCSRLMRSMDKDRASAAFELGSVLLTASVAAGQMKTKGILELCHRLLISKSIRSVTSAELARILQVFCQSLSVIPSPFEDIADMMLCLQQSFWSLVKSMMPAYVGLLQRLLDALSGGLGTEVQALAASRVFADLNSHTGLKDHLAPLLLSLVNHLNEDAFSPTIRDILLKAILPLLKHLDVAKTSPDAVDLFSGLLLMCHNGDQRTTVKTLVEDYRQSYKYTGKA